MSDDLSAELTRLIIAHPLDFQTNTPPELLAEHMLASARQFEQTLLARAAYFNRPTGAQP